MKRYGRQALLLSLLALCVLVSCRMQAQPPEEDPNAIRLYFLNNRSDTGSAIAAEPYTGEQAATVRILINALLKGPAGEGLSSPFPAGTTLRGWSVEDGLLQLDLSEQYGDLSGIDLTLADYCMALTLCQLEGVERVRITVAGLPLAYRGHDILDPSEAMLDGLVPASGKETDGEEFAGGELSGEAVPDEVLSGVAGAVSGEKSPDAS